LFICVLESVVFDSRLSLGSGNDMFGHSRERRPQEFLSFTKHTCVHDYKINQMVSGMSYNVKEEEKIWILDATIRHEIR
jgi:hypothetical protein